MTTYEDIRRTRRLVKIGIAIGYAAALALTVVRIVNTDPVTLGETLGSLALGAILATPATLAVLSLDRRPSLLPAAALGSVVTTFVTVILLPVGLGVAYLWYRGWVGRPVRPATSVGRGAARIGLAFAMLAAFLVLFVHVDPVCTQALADGTSRTVDAAERGLSTGWAFSTGTTSSTGSSSAGGDVLSESCTSNTVVLGEALASLALTAIVLEVGRRWPQGVAHLESPGSSGMG